MSLRDEVTPTRVLKALAFLLCTTGLAIFLIESAGISSFVGVTGPEIWRWFMDLVAITSLLLTILILADLEEIQSRYLLRATIPDLQERLEERAKDLGTLLRSGFEDSRREIGKELSKTEGILKQVRDRVEGVDSEVRDTVEELRERIKESDHSNEDMVYDVWETLHSVNEQLKGLVEESKWKR